MNKKYIWVIAIILSIVLVFLLIIKSSWQENPQKASSDLGNAAKANSFQPVMAPTMSSDEKVDGSMKAPVKVIVYEDYSDIFSAELAINLQQLSRDYDKKVSFAFRPFATKAKPLSLLTAMAVECAAEQDKWQEMRQEIFGAVQDANLDTEKILGFADKIGLDKSNFSQCLTNSEKQGIMLQVADNAKKFSVYGAPTIFVNSEMIIGARPYEDYSEDGVVVEGLRSLVARQLR